MPRSGFHVRRPGEYDRPAGRLALHERADAQSDRYPRWLRGAPYHRDVFTGRCREGDVVEVELVPERFNRHDLHAVAVDYAGERVGYLPAGEAAWWHDNVLALNRRGDAVWTTGHVESVQFEGLRRLSVKVAVPTVQVMCQRRG